MMTTATRSVGLAVRDARVLGLAVLGVALVGCAQDSSRPVPRVPVPTADNRDAPVRRYEPMRPLRGETPEDQMNAIAPPPFDDVPIVTQEPAEQPAYLEAYARVGRPRVAVFVNRTVEGRIVPVDERRLIAGYDVTRETNAAVDLEARRDTDRWNRSTSETDRFKTDGPARVSERGEVYLAPGQYDDVQAKSLDYEAIELALADVLAAQGRVTLVSPTMARQRLSDEEIKELQAGRPQVLREVAEKLDVDVLIQVQARPTKQTSAGLGVRILVEAINTRGGESIGRSFVDVPPPLEKPTINRYARFLARKTMIELTGSWMTLASTPPRDAPTTQRQ